MATPAEKLYDAVKSGRIKPTDLNDEGKKTLREYIINKNVGATAGVAPLPARAAVADMRPGGGVLSAIANNPILSAPSRFAESALSGLSQGLYPKPAPAQNIIGKAADITGGFTGEALPFVAGYGITGKALGPALAKAPKLAQLAIKGGVASGGVMGAKAAIKGEPAGEVAKQAGIGAALGAVGDPLLEMGAIPLISKAGKGLWAKTPQSVKGTILKRFGGDTVKAAEVVEHAAATGTEPQQILLLPEPKGYFETADLEPEFRKVTSDIGANWDSLNETQRAVIKRLVARNRAQTKPQGVSGLLPGGGNFVAGTRMQVQPRQFKMEPPTARLNRVIQTIKPETERQAQQAIKTRQIISKYGAVPMESRRELVRFVNEATGIPKGQLDRLTLPEIQDFAQSLASGAQSKGLPVIAGRVAESKGLNLKREFARSEMTPGGLLADLAEKARLKRVVGAKELPKLGIREPVKVEMPFTEARQFTPSRTIEPPIEPQQGFKMRIPKLFEDVSQGISGAPVPKLPMAKQAAATTEREIKPQELKDISGFHAYTTDVYRNFRDVFGKNYEAVKKRILDPFDVAKKANVDMQEEWATKLKTEVVDKLGIGKNTKLSALVQKFGEGEQKIFNPKTKQVEVTQYTLDDLKRDAPDDWEKVVEADKWFRKAYDQLLEEVNAVRARIYPNQPGKIIPRRQNYYRHFREMADSIEGVKNLFETPAAIDPSLAGVSDFTKPRSKFLSFAQKRGLGPFKNDAVGGFLDYIKAASYAKNIDPQIGAFRGLAKELAEATGESKNLNHFIEYLQDFANDLAGKTNPFDRAFQKVVPGGRVTLRAIDWLNRRVKANVILGNIGSAFSQLANIPQGLAFAKEYAALGMGKTMKNILPQLREDAIKQSGFLKERFQGSMYRQFDTKWFQQPKNFAVWMMETADRIGTEFIWNSAYEKALAESIAEPVKYADDIARQLVAGRGIGEMPLIQKSRVFQIAAPFQVEVANLWQVQRDFLKEKDFGALAALYLANFLFNNAMEQVRGSGVVFDPIQAFVDALGEEDISSLQRGGRLAGEVLSNIPLGQTVAAAYPEYGGNIMGAELPSRRELFGRSDPTRFGPGLLAVKGLQDPLFKVLPPYGGLQAQKTIKGALGLRDEGVYTEHGNVLNSLISGEKGGLKYPVEEGVGDAAKGLLFGPSAFEGTNRYYEENRRPLTKKQTEALEKSAARGKDKGALYEKVQVNRRIETIERQISEVRKDKELSKEERTAKIKKLNDKKKKLAGQRADILQQIREGGGN